jgi:hypothetical protein
VLDGDGDQVAGVEEASVGVPDGPFALQAARAKPIVGDAETSATMVGLRDHHGLRDPVDRHEAGMRN